MSCQSCSGGGSWGGHSSSHKKRSHRRHRSGRRHDQNENVLIVPPAVVAKPKFVVPPAKPVPTIQRPQYDTYYAPLQAAAGSQAFGNAELHVNAAGNMVSYTITARNLTGQVGKASFVSGSIQQRNVVSIEAASFNFMGDRYISRGNFPIDGMQYQLLTSRQWVVVVTSSGFPLGELRGQLQPYLLQ